MKKIFLCLLTLLLLLTFASCKKNDEDDVCVLFAPKATFASFDEWLMDLQDAKTLKKEMETMSAEDADRLKMDMSNEERDKFFVLRYWDSCFDVQLRSERYSLKEILVDDDSVTYTFKTESQEKPSVQVIIKRAKDFEERFGESAEDFFYRDHEKGARRFDINREGRYVMVILPISLGVETEEQLWELLSIEEIPLTSPEETTE